jgi:hypothetical protein
MSLRHFRYFSYETKITKCFSKYGIDFDKDVADSIHKIAELFNNPDIPLKDRNQMTAFMKSIFQKFYDDILAKFNLKNLGHDELHSELIQLSKENKLSLFEKEFVNMYFKKYNDKIVPGLNKKTSD